MAARSVIVLLAVAAVVLGAAGAAALSCAPTCVLTQCPCYGAQVDGTTYARPPGCVAQVLFLVTASSDRCLSSRALICHMHAVPVSVLPSCVCMKSSIAS